MATEYTQDFLKMDSESDVDDESESGLGKKNENAINKAFEACADDAAKETLLRQQLVEASTLSNYKLQKTFKHLQTLVPDKIPARCLCEQILACESLTPDRKFFWVESFKLIQKVISHVDYKGVREVMKICRDKGTLFPKELDSTILPQMRALTDVLKMIFDRNACLLPAYFIITEIQKSDGFDTHWQISNLIAEYVEEFINVAQMLSIIGHSEMLPVVEHGDHIVNSWRLEPTTLKFNLKGSLPYNHSLTQPQTKLLRFVLEQPYSRDFVCSMLNLQKSQRVANEQLEKNLIWLIVSAMERSESSSANAEEAIPSHWLHLSSQVIYFVLFQFATFPNIVRSLHSTLAVKELRKGRNQLMWVLLQFISGSIQRNPVQNFLPVLKLFDILYPEKEPLPIPDVTKPSCAQQMAATCIWIHLTRKAKLEPLNVTRTIPPALRLQNDFLQQLAGNASALSLSDYTIALLCNAYSTNQDYFSRPMAALIDTIQGNKNTNCLSMYILDSLTVHSKMSLIHSIVTHLIKQAQTKNTLPNTISPALVETYSRLLVYTEIESLGIKGFLTQLLPAVFKSHAWGILYTLLEMFSYRINFHIQAHYRVQLLSHLHALSSVPHTDQMQLHLCVESTALRLIQGLASTEVQTQISRYYSEPKVVAGSVVSTESEELNRALILTLARSMTITNTGNDSTSNAWCKDLLTQIIQNTPHTWSPYTLQCFPNFLKEFFSQCNVPKENKQNLKKSVEEEYRNWVSMTNENDIIAHFSVSTNPPLFLCLTFKMLLETEQINNIVFKVLERIGARALSAHLRKLCDYIILEISSCGVTTMVTKCIDCITQMIWKYSLFSIDMFLLSLVLRAQEANETQVSFYIIQLLLLKTTEFRNRIQEFVSENSPEHWKQNSFDKIFNFHQKFPEKFTPEETSPHLPVYFGNVCLRFIPVLDIIVHRFLEYSSAQMNKTLEVILDNLGCLYKFHDRPITYLYNTLFYYEPKLRDRPLLKKKLVGSILGSLFDLYPNNWALSEPYKRYLQTNTDAEDSLNLFTPDVSYYCIIIKRLLDAIEGTNVYPGIDWRFNEFPNAPTFTVLCSAVELISLPVAPKDVANNLMDTITKAFSVIPHGHIQSWINAIGLIMVRLPEPYWLTIFERLQFVLTSPSMRQWNHHKSPFVMFNFKEVSNASLDGYCAYNLAIAHSVIHHFGIGQMTTLTEQINQGIKPLIKTEQQLIYLCHIVGPFLQRLDSEIPRAVMDLTVILYEALEQVDKANAGRQLQYMDPICDLLYHLKYMHVGDMLKAEIEAIIIKLRPALRMRLRFITRLNVNAEKMETEQT